MFARFAPVSPGRCWVCRPIGTKARHIVPEPFTNLVDYLQPFDPASRAPRFGDEALAWLARIHFGRAWGPWVKTVWVILGLMPAALFVTGALMWWNRWLRKKIQQLRGADRIYQELQPPRA